MSVYLRKYTNAQSRFISINGSLVHYRDEGEGPVILLIHGIFSSLHTFDGWTKILKKDFRVIRLDLPGFGLSQVSEDHIYSMARYHETINQLMDHLEIERFHVAGNSLGGWLAWEYAIDFPERTDKLILIDSAGIETDRHVPLPVRLARLPMARYLMRFLLNRKTVSVFAKEVYAHPETVSDKTLDRYYDLFVREGNPEAFISLVNAPFEERSQEIHTIQNQTLIIWGEADKWLPVINGYRFLEMIPNASLIIYDDLGHVPMEEAPKVTAKDAREFLLGSPTRDSSE